MKQIVLFMILNIHFCMKKGGSFSRIIDINTQSIKNFDEPVYSLNQR